MAFFHAGITPPNIGPQLSSALAGEANLAPVAAAAPASRREHSCSRLLSRRRRQGRSAIVSLLDQDFFVNGDIVWPSLP